MEPRAPLVLRAHLDHKEKQGRKGIGVLRGCLGQKEKTANKD